MAYPSDSQFIPFLLGGSPFGDVRTMKVPALSTYDPKIQFVSALAGQTTRADISSSLP